jgi:hypothetical protein
MRQVRQIVTEMMIGLAVWGVFVLVVLEIVSHGRLAMAAGVLLGVITAAGLIFHMCRHLDIALDMDSGHAQSHTQVAAVQRLVIMAVVLALSMTQYRYIHPVGTVCGIYGLKISAFLQPQVHKLRSRYRSRVKSKNSSKDS